MLHRLGGDVAYDGVVPEPDIDLTAEEAALQLQVLRENLERLVEARSARGWSPQDAREYIRLASCEAVLLQLAERQ